LLTVFCSLFCAGINFGFAALKPVLIRQGVYSDLCEDDREHNVPHHACKDQDLQLNFLFTLSAVFTNVSALPIGMTLDRLGPRWTSIIGATFFALGNFMFGLQYRAPGIDTYVIGYILLSIGGPMTFMPTLHLSNAFPTHSGTILSLLTGAFDASTIPFLAYNVLAPDLPVRTWFWTYMIIPALLIAVQLTVAPGHTYQGDEFRVIPAELSQDDARVPLLNGSASAGEYGAVSSVEEPSAKVKEHLGVDPLYGAIHGRPAGKQIASTFFLSSSIILIHPSRIRINFFIQTVGAQMLFYMHSVSRADSLTTLFNVALPFAGILGVPFVAFLLDKQGSFRSSLTIMVAGALFGIFGLTSIYELQMLQILILVVFRPLMYTFVSDYAAKSFGFESFGTVYGLANTIAGLFNLILRPVDVLVKDNLRGNFTPVNVALVVLGSISSAALGWRIWSGGRRQFMKF
ncbi:MFS general substrate transporter, partial [Sistotremastrum suecicum HHB10207 ss-3]